MGRKRKPKNRRGWIWSLLTFFLVVGAILASVTVFLKVSEVEVSGAEHYKPEQLIETSGIHVGDNLFLFNKFEVIRKLKAEYPYLEDVEIRRRLPDAFVITVTERQPMAYLDAGESRWLVDKHGYLLEALPSGTAVPYAQIISDQEVHEPVSGTRIQWEKSEELDALEQILTALADQGITKGIGKVDVTRLYQLSFTYEKRILVQLGTREDITHKISLFCKVLEKLAPGDRGALNVSDGRQARFQPSSKLEI